jgi:hypothetical protein
MTATASDPIHLGIGPRPPSYRIDVNRAGAYHDAGGPGSARVSASGLPRSAAGGARLDVARAMQPRRWWRTVVMDSVQLLALVWSVPLAMLLVGAPIALALALLVWLGRLALSAV